MKRFLIVLASLVVLLLPSMVFASGSEKVIPSLGLPAPCTSTRPAGTGVSSAGINHNW